MQLNKMYAAHAYLYSPRHSRATQSQPVTGYIPPSAPSTARQKRAGFRVNLALANQLAITPVPDGLTGLGIRLRLTFA